jgi:dCMP deaminase
MRPSRDDTLMTVAHAFGARSTCSRTHVGAVVSRAGRILTTGYNGAPTGMPHCSDNDHPPITATCSKAVHAETNALIWAARHGVKLEGAELHTTHSPCLPCALLIVQAGIARVVYCEEYRITLGLETLREAGISCEALPSSHSAG